MASESKVAVFAALVGNFLIAMAKLVAGLISGSAAMFAEAAHSFSDVGNQILLLVGIKRASGAPTAKYPFGTGKAAYFWPFMVAVLLFGVAGAYSLLEGLEKLRHPHEIGDIRLSLLVLGLAFAIEAVTLGIAVVQAKQLMAREGLTWRRFADENRDASLLTVLVEDSLALLGLPLAATALVLAKVTGDPRWDAAGSMVIGAMLMGFALFLGSNVRGLLIGRGLGTSDLQTLRDIVSADPDILEVRKIRTMHLGPQSALLGAEILARPGMSVQEQGAAMRRLEKAFKEAVPELRYVYLEDHE